MTDTQSIEIDSATKEGSESERFFDFAWCISAVPNEEYDTEIEAIKRRKPLKNPFDKKPIKPGKETVK